MYLHFVKGARWYFEWGSGGSTQLAPFLAGHAASVDMHPEWCEKLQRGNPWAANAVSLGFLSYYCVNHGKPLVAWGHPANAGDARLIGEQYVPSIDVVSKRVPGFEGVYTVIFVDGRYRVCCALYSVWKGYALPGKTFVFIDDFGVRKETYGPVLKYFNLVAGGTKKLQTALFTVKDKFDWEALQEDVKHFMGIPQ